MKCHICSQEMDTDDPTTLNCGGDCLRCMAVIGEDEECEASLLHHITEQFWIDFSLLCNDRLTSVPKRLQDQLGPMLADKTSFYGRSES